MRGTKVKRLRRAYRWMVMRIKDHIPEGAGIISFRVFKRRAAR